MQLVERRGGNPVGTVPGTWRGLLQTPVLPRLALVTVAWAEQAEAGGEAETGSRKLQGTDCGAVNGW